MRRLPHFVALLALTAAPALAQGVGAKPWMDKTKSAQARADAALAAMTQDEKLSLVVSFTNPRDMAKVPDDKIANKARLIATMIPGVSGYVLSLDRLGLPSQTETDASIGVRNPTLPRTALPSSLATAASWDPAVTYAGGAMIGGEARRSGFDVMLAGGGDLAREPRNGRNFEYVGEDPWLAGRMAGGLIRGIQSNHIISTMKHFAVNDQESLRTTVNAQISDAAMRQSDLLAFQFIKEQGDPGSVMCSYNLVNGLWACENPYLLTRVLKGDWGFKGYVMSDWGADHSTVAAANAGLDQQSGYPSDKSDYFGKPLAAAIEGGQVPEARLDDMARRILWALFDKGVVDDPVVQGPIDFAADAKVARGAADQSLTLLKNSGGLLPLKGVRSIAVIGGHADKGVLAGGGSSSVTPIGGNAVPGVGPAHWPGPETYLPSSPLQALQAAEPRAKVAFAAGDDMAAAAQLAAHSDVAVVFVTQWAGEGFDVPLELQDGQDALVEAVVKANPRTLVVVESGGAVFMPWRDRVPAILEAFYPGSQGGPAIADILTGKVNPSGHLPITFPASLDQLAHREIAGFGQRDGTASPTVIYDEGAAIGYKWYDLKGFRPEFAFGHGLSYSRFVLAGLRPRLVGSRLSVRFTVRNASALAGQVTAQVYVAPKDFRAVGWEAPKRLAGFAKVPLRPGDRRALAVTVDPRLLAIYDEKSGDWVITPGVYRIELGQASDDLPLSADVALPGWRGRL